LCRPVTALLFHVLSLLLSEPPRTTAMAPAITHSVVAAGGPLDRASCGRQLARGTFHHSTNRLPSMNTSGVSRRYGPFDGYQAVAVSLPITAPNPLGEVPTTSAYHVLMGGPRNGTAQVASTR